MKQLRPLLEKEHKILDKELRRLDRNLKRQVRFLLIWISLAVVAGIFAFFNMDSGTLHILLIVTIATYIVLGVRAVGKNHWKRQKRNIIFLKNKNLATSIEVASDKFYELKEDDDEGVHYLFQLDGNKVFSFGGQDFYPTKTFPSDRFEIVEGRGIDDEVIFLEIFSSGRKIKPLRVITGQEKWSLLNNPDYPDPTKLTVIDGQIEDIV